MRGEFLQQLLPSFYRSAEQPGNWCHALDLIRDEMQLGSVVVQMLRRDGDRLTQEWVARDSISTTHAESHDCLVNNDENPRLDLSDVQPPVADSTVIRDECQKTADSPRFKALRERMQLLGLGRPAILGVRYGEDRNLCMILHRRYDDAREFSEGQERFLHLLTPHLKQTVSLQDKIGQLQEQSQFLSHSLDQFNTGVLVLDGAGELRWANTLARQVLGRSQHVSQAGSRLRCSSREDQQLLDELIEHARKEPCGRFVGKIGPEWNAPLQLLAVPIRAGTSPGIVLYISESGVKTDLSALEIVRLFGLTPAEARLAVALYEGCAVNEYAAKQGISSGTARIQLKSIFSKLGVHRQPELVRLLGASISAKTLHSVN
ncbi:helix-turn-helix transcriptional regulator [Microbulbifer sp. MCCC 1A16149]|uniref:helix-turn-helix transcriptional regulator n=1 Tax=Microbulbifer sp. MCCC 1A16149 TaxID=3411322 RepID=UPI003D132BF1